MLFGYVSPKSNQHFTKKLHKKKALIESACVRNSRVIFEIRNLHRFQNGKIYKLDYHTYLLETYK